MAKLSYKVSYYVLYALIAIILIVLALFYGVGYNHIVGEYNAPENTDALIYLMYILFGVTVAATLVGAIVQFAGALKDNPKNAVRSLLGIILLVVVLCVAYAVGSDASIKTAGLGLYEDKFWLKITDMFLYSIYFLMGVAILATLVNLTGIFKK